MNSQFYTSLPTIAAVTPTICRAMNLTLPVTTNVPPLQEILKTVEAKCRGEFIEKCLVFAPDAIGVRQLQLGENFNEELMRVTGQEVSLSSVFPPKTPVCFASMFTGAEPKVHGIMKYEKPVLTCETIFDSLVKAGKKTAIVAVKNSSIDLIFRKREIDYYSELYDREVLEKSSELLEENNHDFILAYEQEYDDYLHNSDPFDSRATEIISQHIKNFINIAERFHNSWSNYNRMLVFAPDHGAHLDKNYLTGNHGDDIAEDMEVKHFFGIFSKKDKKMQ